MEFPIFKGSALEVEEHAATIIRFASLLLPKGLCVQQLDGVPCWPMKTKDFSQAKFIMVMTN